MIRPTFTIPDRLTVEKTSWPNRWQISPIFGVDLHPLYDGSGQKQIYPDGIIRTPEEAKAIADELVKRWNLHGELVAALKEIVGRGYLDPKLLALIDRAEGRKS